MVERWWRRLHDSRCLRSRGPDRRVDRLTSAAAAAAVPKAQPRSLYSPSDPLVAFRVVLSVGSQNDPPGKEGLAALTASMVAEGGSKSLTYNQILAAFYPMAATVKGSCYKEMTVFAGVIHRDNMRAYIPDRDRDDRPAQVRPRGLRAAPQ